jgi:hypothetical protein
VLVDRDGSHDVGHEDLGGVLLGKVEDVDQHRDGDRRQDADDQDDDQQLDQGEAPLTHATS